MAAVAVAVAVPVPVPVTVMVAMAVVVAVAMAVAMAVTVPLVELGEVIELLLDGLVLLERLERVDEELQRVEAGIHLLDGGHGMVQDGRSGGGHARRSLNQAEG